MKERTKRVYFNFLAFDYKAMEEYFEEMAEKGWMLVKVGGLTAKFRSIEPKKLKFHVDVFKEGGPLTPENSEEVKSYKSQILKQGWNYITSRGYLYFFCAEDDEIIIPTRLSDSDEEKNIRFLLKKEFISIAVFLVIAVYLLFISTPMKYTQLLSFVGVASVFVFPLFTVVVLLPSLYGIIYALKARKNIKVGLAIEKPSLKNAKIRAIVFNLPIFVLLLIIASAFIADSFFRPRIIAMSLAGPAIGTIIGLSFRYIIKKKVKEKKDVVLYAALAIVVLMFAIPITSSLFSKSNEDILFSRDSIPADYPIIKISELLQSSEEGKMIYRSFDAGMSPVVLKHYKLRETGEIDGKEVLLFVRYYEAINPYFADVIYNGIIEELRRGIKFRGMYLLTKTVVIENEMKDLWKVDGFAITDKEDEIIAIKGNIVIHLSANIDFKESYVIQLIENTFFHQ